MAHAGGKPNRWRPKRPRSNLHAIWPIRGETGGTFKATLKTLLRSDDGRVVGIHHNSAKRNGKILEVDCCIVFEFKDGRIIDGKEHFYDLHAWDEFWS